MPGDIYCCIDRISAMDVVDSHDDYNLQQAVSNGAIAVVADMERDIPELPDDIPLLAVEDVEEFASRLAAVFYGELAAVDIKLHHRNR